MLGLINRNFKHKLCPFPLLWHYTKVWSDPIQITAVLSGRPTEKEIIEALEKVQKRATKLIPALKNLPYKNHLKSCNMSTLHYRRVRGDMIETYKILSGKYDTTVVPHLKTTDIQVTRGG